MQIQKSAQRIEINRPAVALLVAAAFTVAVAPVILIIGQPLLLILVALETGVAAYLAVRKARTVSTFSPGLAEYGLFGIQAVYTPAFFGVMWLVFYFLIFGMCELIWGILGWVGITVGVRSDLVAFYITSLVAVILLPSLAYLQTEESVKKLYPETAGLRSAYYGMIRRERRRLSLTSLAAIAGLILLMALGIIFRWTLGGVLYVLQVYLFFFSLVIVPPDAGVSRRKSAEEIISAVGALFEAAGYEVEFKPRTQDSVVDPLLMEVDLVATRDGQHLFIDVKTAAENSRSLDWRSVSALKQASWILSEQRNLRLEESNARLIMVDVPPDATLETAGGEEDIPIVYLDSEEIHQVLQTAGGQEKQSRALRLLGLLPINEESTPAFD